MAKEMGAFEKNVLRAELVYISSGAITVQAMVGGDLTMTVAASNAVINAVLRGAPLLAVGSVTNSPAMNLWVQPEITKPDQLQGKILGITRHGSTTHFLSLAVLDKLGLQEKVKLQPFGGTVEADTAFRAGIIAGRVSAVRPGPQAHSLVDLPKLNIPFSMDLIAVKQDFYNASPKTVERMLKAYIEGVAALRKKEQAYKVLGKYLRRRSANLQEPYEYAVKYLDPVPKVDPAVIQTVLDWEGKSDVPVSRFFDNTILDRLVQDGFIERLYPKS
jgi:ABC-type nitrate/sulfonate/bicarbonate transport system substrate-binding protein